jgi:predicted phage terminase large subunit-like protein
VQSIIAHEIGTVEEAIQSWDCAFKDLETSDYVVGQVWGRRGSAYLLLDQVRDRMDCPTTVKAVRHLSQRWRGTIVKLIEDKANGSTVIQMLGRELPGILPVNPEGGKVARAAAVSPLIEAGNVYLPHPQFMPWVNDFIEECAAFPNGAHDDQVDAMTQALLRWNMVPQQTVVCRYVPYQISPV